MVAKFFFFVINAHKPFIKCHLINSLKINFQILKIEEYSGKCPSGNLGSTLDSDISYVTLPC